MIIQQFEHDGFNSQNEVDVAQRKADAPSKSERNLSASLRSINSIKSHMRAIQRRFLALEHSPGGRAQLPPAELIEYDSIDALYSDLRAILRATT